MLRNLRLLSILLLALSGLVAMDQQADAKPRRGKVSRHATSGGRLPKRSRWRSTTPDEEGPEAYHLTEEVALAAARRNHASLVGLLEANTSWIDDRYALDVDAGIISRYWQGAHQGPEELDFLISQVVAYIRWRDAFLQTGRELKKIP